MSRPAESDDEGPGVSGSGELARAVAKVLGEHGQPVGTCFFVGESLLVTCAHVIESTGSHARAGRVRLGFPGSDDEPRTGLVDPDLWRDPADGDIAFIRLPDPAPATVSVLRLGTSSGIRSRHVKTFGFPANAPGQGHYGYGVAGDTISSDSGVQLLQLTECTEVTEGFSGGPVVDEHTGLVIGMVDSIASPDRYHRGRSTVYVTPVEALREVCPDLAVSEVCPYLGLRPFASADADLFYGRNRAVDAVLASFRGNPEFIALFGPSGSGKSSLMQAGVLPALARARLAGSDRWGCLVARPGTDPWSQLAEVGLPEAEHGVGAAMRRWLTANPGHDRLVLVFDQFEELLTAATPHHRAELLAQLSDLHRQELPASVAVVMRDDFYSTLAAAAPGLMPAITRSLVNIPAILEPGELIAIIERPAVNAGLVLEPHLSERIAQDAALISGVSGLPGSERPGAPVTVLPLLSSALVELWHRRVGNRLTHEAYDQIGGVVGWLDRWCDRGFAEACAALTDDQRSLAQLVITSLVRPGDELERIPPTRQRRLMSQLPRTSPGQGGEVDPDAEAVVAALTDHRLLVTSLDQSAGAAVVELAHEALIHEWGRLRRWLADDREFLVWRRDLEADYARWQVTASSQAEGDPQQLLKGAALIAARQWKDRRPAQLRSELTRFIDSSDRTEQHRLTRDRRRVVVFAILAIVSTVLAVVAAGTATIALRQNGRVSSERNLAEFNEVTAQANAQRTSDSTLAAQLDLIAYHMQPNKDLYTDLINTETAALSTPLASDGSVDFGDAIFSSDGKNLAATGNDSSYHLWDLASPAGPNLIPVSLTGHSKTVSIAFSSHGHTMAAFAAGGVFSLWDLADPGHPVRIGGSPSSVYEKGDNFAVYLSSDGRVLAANDFTGSPIGNSNIIGNTLRLWDLANPRHPVLVTQNLTGTIPGPGGVALSPDERFLATIGPDCVLRLWNIATPSHPVLIGRPVATGYPLGGGELTLQFSPDGRTLSVFPSEGAVSLWNVANPVHPARVTRSLPGTSDTLEAQFSPSGKILVTVDENGTFRLWSLADPGRPVSLGKPVTTDSAGATNGAIGSSAIAFAPGDRVLATSSPDHSIRLWNLSDPAHPIPLGQSLIGATTVVVSLAFSPDGRELVGASSSGGVRLWSIPQTLLIGDSSPITSVAASPDRHTFATGSMTAVRLWKITRPGSAAVLSGQIPGASVEPSAFGTSLSVSADGRVLAMAPGEGGVSLWDIARPGSPALLGHIPADGSCPGPQSTAQTGSVGGQFSDPLVAVAFSPRGRVLATSSQFGTIRLWDVSNPRGPARCIHVVAYSNRGGLAFSPDGHVLAIGGPALWNVSKPNHPVSIGRLSTKESSNSLAFGAGGRILAVADGDNIRVWNLTNLRHPTRVDQPLTGHTDFIESVAFSPDGHTLASAGEDGTIRLWSFANPTRPKSIGQPLTDGNIGNINAIAFSRTGNTLITGSDDQVVRIWNLNPDQAIQRICTTTRNTITRQQWNNDLLGVQFTPPCG